MTRVFEPHGSRSRRRGRSAQQELGDALATAHRVAAHLLAGAGEIAGGLELGESTSETKLDRARLSRQASPAKVAKDGQHDDDDDDDPKPGRHVILSLGACPLYREPTRICKVCGLGRLREGARSGERLRESGQDHEAGMKLNAVTPRTRPPRPREIGVSAMNSVAPRR